jgi:hypothetical protein
MEDEEVNLRVLKVRRGITWAVKRWWEQLQVAR